MILGVDEAGRGAWAGPLVAGAVILDTEIDGINDSKKLTKAKREGLFKQVQQAALDIGIGWVHAAEIDKIGLSRANGLAMERAVAQISTSFNEAIIDGNIEYIHGDKFRAEIKADGKYESVSAASIVAKVSRDRFMLMISGKYPDYGFEAHVGYGVSVHRAAIEAGGATKIHRMSYKPVKEADEFYRAGKKGRASSD